MQSWHKWIWGKIQKQLKQRNKLRVLPYLICVDQIGMNPLVSILLSKRI